jgi:CBS domain-containing protein
MSTTVEQMLKDKETSIVSIDPEAAIPEAVDLMIRKNLGALLVMKGEDLLGIISERDISRNLGVSNKLPREFKVKDFMSEQIVFVEPDHTLEECMGLMTKNRFRHLPVLENRRKVIGVVSIGDAVKTLVSDKQFEIKQLERYIYGQGS